MAYWSLHLSSQQPSLITALTVLQRAAFVHFPDLQDFALSNVAAVDTRESLNKIFGNLR